jgi:hypothetical protein
MSKKLEGAELEAFELGLRRMAEAVIGSLQSLRLVIASDVDTLEKWKHDPVTCFDVMIFGLEGRHVHGLDHGMLIKMAESFGEKGAKA